jgi:TM2 domain-containing membrane protein YozV
VTFATPTVPNDFTPQQKLYFQHEYDKQVRNPSTALVLTLLLGGLGAHRFYLQQWGWGIAYIIFGWTFIPFVVSLIECFLIRKRTEDYNKKCAELITEKMNVILRRQRGIELALQ